MKNFIKKILHEQSGQTLMELMVTIGLAAIIIPALLTGFFAARNGRAQAEQRQKAIALVREGQESMRIFREADWTTFAGKAGGTLYYPCTQSNTWAVCTGTDPHVPSGFTRTIQISDVYRDSTFAIVPQSSNPGVYMDPSTKQVTVVVSWLTPIPKSVTATEYLTRIGDIPYSDSGTSQPPAGGGGDWCNPNATPAAEISLAGGLNDVSITQGSGNVISFVGSGNSANGLTYADITITDPSSPTAPVPSVVGSVNNNPQTKTNGAFNEVNFGYLATDQHATNGQGIIVDLSKIVTDPTHSVVGTLDLGIAANGQSIYVLNNIAYLTADDGNLYTFNIATRTGSHAPIGHVLLNGGGSKVYGKKINIVGEKAYIAVSSTTSQLQIVDVSNPASPGAPVSISVGNSQGAKDLFVDPNRLRVYLVTSYASSTTPDFFTIDVNPSDTSWYKKIINTYITANSMTPTGVVYVSGSKAVIVGTGSNWNYQVIDASLEGVPPPALSICGAGGAHVSYNIYGVATLFTNASRTYSYIITSDSGKEYKIIEGGTGSGGSGNGIFESSTFDAGHDVAFNYFSGTSDPALSYKIDIEKAVGGVCPTNYTNFTAISTGPIPFSGVSYTNPGQCMRYQVINSGATAKSYTVRINYSP